MVTHTQRRPETGDDWLPSRDLPRLCHEAGRETPSPHPPKHPEIPYSHLKEARGSQTPHLSARAWGPISQQHIQSDNYPLCLSVGQVTASLCLWGHLFQEVLRMPSRKCCAEAWELIVVGSRGRLLEEGMVHGLRD